MSTEILYYSMGIRVSKINYDTKLKIICWDHMNDWFYDVFSYGADVQCTLYNILSYLVVGNVGRLHEGDQRSQIVQSGQFNLHHVM